MSLFTKLESPKFWQEVEFNRFGLMALFLTLQSCAGSVAVCFLLQVKEIDNTSLLLLVAIPTILANAFTIAQSSMKVIVASFSIVILLSIIITAISLMYL